MKNVTLNGVLVEYVVPASRGTGFHCELCNSCMERLRKGSQRINVEMSTICPPVVGTVKCSVADCDEDATLQCYITLV